MHRCLARLGLLLIPPNLRPGSSIAFRVMQVRIYNTALSVDQVEILYTQGRRSELVSPFMRATDRADCRSLQGEKPEERMFQAPPPTISAMSESSESHTHRSSHTGGVTTRTSQSVRTSEVHTDDDFEYPDESSSSSGEDNWHASKVLRVPRVLSVLSVLNTPTL
jgi:hypothetical protein